ncbi:threonine aldolase family protein [Sellimonas caecigallum]|uniref:Low specificity L-threonine aldolase n=1 Tax=Sellimonas caecigallum TaxID=2592333 RepID=A0ABS7L656_9FIRM|nr:aminotransferase class V-fold PLP-dependent enzyme [Sellimonas caecigallum]MBY0758490.1 low specificity L-threonine aldolase [Sellimonas caecigallum]
MILFNNDYAEGAHPKVMERLLQTNMEQTVGYGEDPYCEAAREKVRKACQAPDADVHFLVGGTQANMTVISAALRPHQGAVCVQTGHINVHETGAVEATGHKVLALEGTDGKIKASQVQEMWKEHWADGAHEHIVQPKLVYISHPTELGTLYTKQELTDLRAVCDACGMYLFLDGARLAYGLAAEGMDVTLADIAALTDVFYIGGTKSGALFGECVVIKRREIKEDFRYMIKQKGGMLAKGRLLGVQFDTLFEGNLYVEMGRHADRLAMKLKNGLKEKGYHFYIDSITNQQFVIVDNEKLQEIEKNFGVNYEKRLDENHMVIRICTSWATKEENVDKLLDVF